MFLFLYLEDEGMFDVGLAKEEFAAFLGVLDEALDAVSQPLKQLTALLGADEEDGQIELQSDAPEHGMPVHLHATWEIQCQSNESVYREPRTPLSKNHCKTSRNGIPHLF